MKERSPVTQELTVKLATMTRIARQAVDTAQGRQRGTEKVPNSLLDVSRAIREVNVILEEVAGQIESQAKIVAISNWQSVEEQELLNMVTGIADAAADLVTLAQPESVAYSPEQIKAALTTSESATRETVANLSDEEWQKLTEMRGQNDQNE